MPKTVGLGTVILLAWLVGACTEKSPPRELIPVLKQAVYQLQEAVKTRDRTAIESLLSSDLVSNGQDADSLLRFAFGQSGGFQFERFGNCEYVFTRDKARIDCYVMDSTARKDRPAVLTFVHQRDRWLLKRFESGRIVRDSV
ncbi:MAG TPA: hypothetical protein VN285_13465 [Candidatus Deferrimicrobium sp.]|nr:hypothetical protein [Candidatus Deferrimicrobium sp.]